MACYAGVVLAVVLAPASAQGQARVWPYSADAETIFGNGLEAYRQERFDAALNHLRQLAEFPLNQRSSAGQLLLGKSLYRLGRFAEAIDAALVLQHRFPMSRYLPDARLLVGDSFFNRQHYPEAASQYGRLLATQAPLIVQAQAAERLAAMRWNGQIKEQDLTRLRQAVGAERLREALFFGRVRWFQRLGWQEEAARAMQAYRDSVASGIFASVAAVRGSGQPAPRQRVGPPRLGLLLPLTGPYRRIGEELREGVQLANREAGSRFELIVADTGVDYGNLPIGTDRGGDVRESSASGLLRVANSAQQLLDRGVVAIVGPLFSSSSVVAAAIAERAGVPLLVPLAQQSGLDALGRSVFQLSTVPKTQARLLAEYATLVLGLEHLVLIAPLSDYGWDFTHEFTRIAERNGGQIAHGDWYVPNETKDFRRVFEEIRSAGFALRPPPLPSDTLEVVEETLAADMFIDTIDGVVVVAESFADAKTIAPQVHFHRLQTQVLGNDAWWDPEAIRQMAPGERKNFDGVIFVSVRQAESRAERSFVNAFRKQFRRDPHYAAVGYDATHLLIDGWEQGHRDPAALVEWLGTVRFYEGASGVISLSPEVRSNSALTLLKIERDKVRSLGTGDLPKMGAAE